MSAKKTTYEECKREPKYKEIVDSTNSAIIVWKPDGTITFFNKYAQAFFGYSADEAIGKSVNMILPQNESPGRDLSALARQIAAHPKRYQKNANENICRDGRRVWMLWTNKALLDDDGQVEEIIAVGTDITREKHIEQALREKEQWLQLTQSAAGFGTFDWDITAGQGKCSPVWFELFGMEPRDHVSREQWVRCVHPDDRARIDDEMEQLWKGGSKCCFSEYRIMQTNGSVRFVQSTGRLLRGNDGRPLRFIGAVRDVTARKMAEEILVKREKTARRQSSRFELRVQERTANLEKLNRELKREIEKRKQFETQLKAQGEKILQAYQQRDYLSRRLVDLLERERREIGNALHDEIGQILTGVSMQLEGLKTFYEKDSQDSTDRVETIQAILRKATRKIRNISQNLRPEVLERFGLIASVRHLINEAQKQFNLKAHAFIKNVPENIDKEKQLTVYRIVQEGLTNVMKHAGATEVSVSLIARNGKLSLTLEDNGRGFDYDALLDTEAIWDSPLGITIMRERTSMVGGAFRVETQPGRGTCIFAEIPMETAHA